MSHRLQSSSFLALALLACNPVLADSLVLNGSFETGTYRAESGYGQGYWYGDPGVYTAAENGIASYDGQRMFRAFNIGHGQSSDVWQLVDLTPYTAQIASGSQQLRLAAMANRVPGSEHTNTWFELTIHAYDGAPSEFPSRPPLLSAGRSMLTDSVASTWELLDTTITLPANTTWIAAGWHWAADQQPLIFEGHYVDAVALTSSFQINTDAVPLPSPVSAFLILSAAQAGTIALRAMSRKGIGSPS